MLKISKIFLLLLLLENISSIETSLDDTERKAIPIKIGTPVEFFRDQNYFKFDYNDLRSAHIFFSFEGNEGTLYLTDPFGKRRRVEYDRNYYYGSNGYVAELNYNGTYYLEVICDYLEYLIGGTLNTFIIGGIMDTINLNKTMYVSDRRLYQRDNFYGFIEYKVSNTEKETIVYFTNPYLDSYYKEDCYPYYPGESPPAKPYDKLTVFEVLDTQNNTIQRNVRVFNFQKGNEYIIRIHPYISIYKKEWSGYTEMNYYYPEYGLYPFTSESLKIINGDEEKYSISGLIIGTIPSDVHKHFFIATDMYNRIYYIRTNESIVFNSDNLKKFFDFNFDSKKILEIKDNETSNVIFMILPEEYESKKYLYVIDEIEEDEYCKDSYSVDANKIKLINCMETPEYFEYYNHISTFTSNKKNLKILFGGENEQTTDNIIFNYQLFPIITKKDNQKYTVTRNKYEPRFTFFGAVNPYLFKVFYEYLKLNYKIKPGINIDNYKTANQAYIRINSKYLPWFEFYNIYFDQFDLKLNLYIKQIYGGSDLYECETQKDQKDLTFLTTPISNTKCKNKKSIFDRLFTFDGTKILSGYITPDSYFDVYAEIEKENNKNIDIYSFTVNDIKIENSAKYLKKDVEYNLNFYVNHLIRLEPVNDVEITITNGQTTSKLNKDNPITEILGTGFKIKSTNDAMVYFITKIPDQLVVQREINLERSKGKIIKLSKLDSDIVIDLGFDGYFPSTFPLEFRRRSNGILYIDNIYEKMKGKLLEGEKLYVYHMKDSNKDMQIEYIDNNLNNKNNDYNVFLIPNNNKTNHLVIDTHERREIMTNFHFCKENTSLYMSLYTTNERDEREVTYLLTNDNYTLMNIKTFSLFKGDNKISFFSNQPVIFSYSYYDLIDESFSKNYETYWEDRKRFYILTINEIKDKDTTSDTVKVKFKPNYRNSSARYIILIARETSKNTLEQFKNPCYVTGLLNRMPKSVKVETIYDVGENYEIEAEVDISNILQKSSSNSNSYLISIISQELRFEKDLNFYQPLKFNHDRKKPDDGSEEDDDEEEGEGEGESKSDGSDKKDGEKKQEDPKTSDNTDGEGLKGASLALAITLPIAGVIIIALIAIIILKRREGVSSGLIEK